MKYSFATISAMLLAACGADSEISTPVHPLDQAPENVEMKSDTIKQINISDTIRPEEFIWKVEGYTEITPMRAYIDDPDDKAPTNVRDKPNGKIIQELPQSEDYVFEITGQENGWFKIENLITYSDEIKITQTQGWIHSSVVGGSSRFCCDKGVPIYEYPEAKEEFYVDQIPLERSLKIKKMYFDFVLVESMNEQGKKIEGWLNQEWICGNPVTTCP